MDISDGKKLAIGLELIVKIVTFLYRRICCDLGHRFALRSYSNSFGCYYCLHKLVDFEWNTNGGHGCWHNGITNH